MEVSVSVIARAYTPTTRAAIIQEAQELSKSVVRDYDVHLRAKMHRYGELTNANTDLTLPEITDTANEDGTGKIEVRISGPKRYRELFFAHFAETALKAGIQARVWKIVKSPLKFYEYPSFAVTNKNSFHVEHMGQIIQPNRIRYNVSMGNAQRARNSVRTLEAFRDTRNPDAELIEAVLSVLKTDSDKIKKTAQRSGLTVPETIRLLVNSALDKQKYGMESAAVRFAGATGSTHSDAVAAAAKSAKAAAAARKEKNRTTRGRRRNVLNAANISNIQAAYNEDPPPPLSYEARMASGRVQGGYRRTKKHKKTGSYFLKI
jgi:hypothetical protein